MRHLGIGTALLGIILLAAPLLAQEGAAAPRDGFSSAADEVRAQLEASFKELAELQRRIGDEQVELTRELGRLEAEVMEVRRQERETRRSLDSSVGDLVSVDKSIKARIKERDYLAKNLADYVEQFDGRLHIAERARYEELLKAARRSATDETLAPREVFEAQATLLEASLDRLHEALGGTRFEGTAIDDAGNVREGSFLMVGPIAVFRSNDAASFPTVAVGTAEKGFQSDVPMIAGFGDSELRREAGELVFAGSGLLPFDPTLVTAHKIAATEEPFLEHVKKGGPVMWPIFIMAGLALLVALYKWLGFLVMRRPSKRKVSELLDAVSRRDHETARGIASRMRGPQGRMLAAGAENLGQPRELVEESMFEQMLVSKMKLQRFLPFIAVCAAAAPLLGLLGTVTGIINTFRMITVDGAGDVKNLSGGISEALITTKFGLIVAIPALLIHAFLSRKARGIVGKMEASAIAFLNVAGKAPARTELTPAAGGALTDQELVRAQVNDILVEMLGPLAEEAAGQDVAVAALNGERAGSSDKGARRA